MPNSLEAASAQNEVDLCEMLRDQNKVGLVLFRGNAKGPREFLPFGESEQNAAEHAARRPQLQSGGKSVGFNEGLARSGISRERRKVAGGRAHSRRTVRAQYRGAQTVSGHSRSPPELPLSE